MPHTRYPIQPEHAIAANGGALTGGILGAVLGSLILGPVGVVMGVAAGLAAGSATGEQIGEALDEREILASLALRFTQLPYYVSEMEWEDYEPAYRYGLRQFTHMGHLPFAKVRQTLARHWPQHSQMSHLTWAQAAKAVAHVWDICEQNRESTDTLAAA